MKEERKTKGQLIQELAEMRQRVAELEASEAERKRAEEALRESEGKYRVLFETAKDAVFLTDETGKFVDVNQAACESLGYSREELLKLSNKEIDADPRGYEAFLKVRNGLLKQTTFEVNQRRKDGTLLPVEITGSFFTSGGQRLSLAIARDITERKRAEEELIRMSSAVRASMDSVVISDLEGKIIDVNEATLKSYGTDDKRDLMGKSSFDLIAPEDREKAFAGMQEVLEKGYSGGREYHIITKDGSRIPVEMSVAIMKDVDGKPIGFVGITRDITERKRAEEQEREAVAAVAAAQMAIDTIEAMDDGVVLFNMDGRVLAVNPAFERMTSYEASELVEQSIAEMLSKWFKPEEIEKTMGLWRTISEGKSLVPEALTWIIKDGREVPTILTVSFIKDAEGNPTTVVVAIKDITELKRAEESLRESEQWLSTTLRSIGDAVIATDAQGLVTLMNPVAEDLTGWDEAEAVGQPLEDVFNIINEQTGERAENPVARVLREGIVVGLANHTILIAKDGTKRPIADSGAPMRAEEGNIIGTVMVFRDITERVRAEEEIASLAKFPGENLNPVLRVAKDGAILYANEASLPLLSVWGCQVGQLLPHDWRKFTLDVFNSGSSKDAEVECEDRILSLAFAPVVDKDYVNVYGLDITERKEMQERLVRTEKLAVLGQLSGGVGHELRNPLGAIKNAAYFLNMVLEEPEPEVKETLEILEKEVVTSERIISSLLDFARPKPPIRRKVDINEVVQEALSRTTVPQNVEVVSQLDEALPAILADPDQLGQVFGNIILNGIQAMPDGGQLVVQTSEVSGKPPRSRWVAISITDTGVGILKENLGRLFEPLFTTRAKGIGLGLAVTRTLVEGHGGTIEVESEIGKGSTFTVRLPLANVKT